jgi:hypothetical protein
MKRVYAYIMSTIKNVDNNVLHTGCVPWPMWWSKKAYYSHTNEAMLKYQKSGRGRIFFGSCKKEMRWDIKEHLKYKRSDDIYVVGISNNTFSPRRVVFILHLSHGMTFATAHKKYPELRGTGIHIEPLARMKSYAFQYYGLRKIDVKYQHISAKNSCKQAIHGDDWIKDIARRYNKYRKCGPDYCFIGGRDSLFFNRSEVVVDESICFLLKYGRISCGKFQKEMVTPDSPIPYPRGRHLVVDGEIATKFIEILVQQGKDVQQWG